MKGTSSLALAWHDQKVLVTTMDSMNLVTEATHSTTLFPCCLFLLAHIKIPPFPPNKSLFLNSPTPPCSCNRPPPPLYMLQLLSAFVHQTVCSNVVMVLVSADQLHSRLATACQISHSPLLLMRRHKLYCTQMRLYLDPGKRAKSPLC